MVITEPFDVCIRGSDLGELAVVAVTGDGTAVDAVFVVSKMFSFDRSLGLHFSSVIYLVF